MPTTLLSAAALADALAADAVTVFDCGFDLADPAAGRAAYLAGHIPGARYLHLDADLSGAPTGRNGRHPLPDRADVAARLAAGGAQAGRQIVAYDASGGAYAARLWWLVRWLGHAPVAVLDGGLAAWIAAGGALAQGEEGAPIPGDLAPSPAPGMPSVDAAGVAARIGDRAWRIVDARAPDRFAGAPNPLDPRPGHVPGAANRCFRDNLGADGRFKDAAALAEDYACVLGDVPAARTILYCGSGVTAAHDLLAMAHAGLEGAALYPGSWSEWASDPSRPVEFG